MILDYAMQVSSAQAETTIATHLSDNTIDLGAVERQRGEPIYAVFTVDTTVTSAGSATVTFNVVTDDNAALSSATTVVASAAIPKATLVAGYQIVMALPPGTALERYLGASYTIGTAALTAGAWSCDFTLDPQLENAFADAI